MLNGSPMFCLLEKIKRFQQDLVDWSKLTFGQSKIELKEKQEELEELALQNNSEQVQRVTDLKMEIHAILHHDELFWRQRSRVIWLPTRDKNTGFFFFFTKGLIKDGRKITSLSSLTKMVPSEPLRITLLRQ